MFNFVYLIRFNWRPNKNYELVIQEKALSGPFGEINKEFKNKFTLDESNNYGDIKFKITGLEKDIQYVVELIDDKRTKIFDTQILENIDELNYLKFPGGKYTLRIFKDLNRNGRWDGADVYTLTQAEPIWYLEKPFTIRANWEQTENITVSF